MKKLRTRLAAIGAATAIVGASVLAAVPAQAADDTIEVRTARGRPALHDGQPIGCEHECGNLCTERLGRAKLCAVQLRSLPSLRLERHLELERPAGAVPAERDPGRCCAEADQLRV